MVLCLTGRIGRGIDTMMTMRIGGSLDDRVAIEGIKLGDQFNSKVVDALIQLALQIGQEGFEGHPVGTILCIGDHNAVWRRAGAHHQPFQGLSEVERNVSIRKIREAIKISPCSTALHREDGVVLPPAATWRPSDDNVKIPGLGARHGSRQHHRQHRLHRPVVSQTSGAVRLFKEGNIVLELHQTARRT
jgi:DNA integrity scanning protein DisA with diadenylate cyclase activity